MIIYCCTCGTDVDAVLVKGTKVYPHRKDLACLPFWMCGCGSFVGCHYKTKDRTKPLGVIPSSEIKSYRSQIHAVLDPVWKSKQKTRSELYRELTQVLGRQYHTADLRTVYECKTILAYLVNNYGCQWPD